MEPRIQYARTADGVSIAFWTLGEGEPLVLTAPLSFSHLELEWRSPELRRWFLRMAERRRIIRYDMRGYGLSQRDVADLSIDANVADVQVLADHLHLERFALIAIRAGGAIAITYAASHPERVSRLVLWSCYLRYSESFGIQQHDMLDPMTDRNWEAYTETHAHIQLGWTHPRAHDLARFIRASIRPDTWLAVIEALKDVDVSPLMGKIACPTLVLADRQYPSPETTRELAAGITNASLIPLEEGTHPALGNTETADAAIEQFLHEDDQGAGERTDTLPEGTAIILFTDIAGSTALTEQLGDSAFRAKARELDERLRSVIREAGGTPVEGKVLGDGVMAVFTSARQAIHGALRCNAAAQDTGLSLHLGIHAGDVIREGNTVYGGAVNMAARIASASAPGEILVSDTVRSLARTSADVAFEDRGEHTLKGIEEPQRLFAVRGGDI